MTEKEVAQGSQGRMAINYNGNMAIFKPVEILKNKSTIWPEVPGRTVGKSLQEMTLQNWIVGTKQSAILFICVCLKFPMFRDLVVGVKSGPTSFLYRMLQHPQLAPTVNTTWLRGLKWQQVKAGKGLAPPTQAKNGPFLTASQLAQSPQLVWMQQGVVPNLIREHNPPHK